MRSATLDSNIYVSALQYQGIGVRLFGLARAGQLRIDTSAAILDEVIGVLRDKYGWEGYRLRTTWVVLSRLANVVAPARMLKVVSDPDDDRILECAVEAGSDCIITRDRHLRKLKCFEGIPILTPEDFLNLGIDP